MKLSAKPVYEEQEKIKLPGKESQMLLTMHYTGNRAVDGVQIAIKYHWDHRVSLRSIALIPNVYYKFWEYMNKVNIKSGKGELEPECIIVFYNIDIRKGSALQKDAMYFEQYMEGDMKPEDVIFSDKLRPDWNQKPVNSKPIKIYHA